MKIQFRQVKWILAMGLVIVSILGCSWFDRSENDPIIPEFSNQLGNFYAGGSISFSQFSWNEGNETVCLNLANAGDFLVTYKTVTKEENVRGPFYIALRAKESARVYIGLLSGERLNSVTLQAGSVQSDASVLQDDGPVERYATPAIIPPLWSDVFTLVDASSFIPLVQDKVACPEPMQVSTKKAISKI